MKTTHYEIINDNPTLLGGTGVQAQDDNQHAFDQVLSFDRTDTKQASEIRFDIYKFMAKYLDPPHPFRDVKALRKAAYRFN